MEKKKKPFIKKDAGDVEKNASMFNNSVSGTGECSSCSENLSEDIETEDEFIEDEFNPDEVDEDDSFIKRFIGTSEKPDVDAVRADDLQRGDKITTDYETSQIESGTELIITDVFIDSNLIIVQALSNDNELIELEYLPNEYIGHLK